MIQERVEFLAVHIRPENNTAYSLDDIGNARLFYTTFGHLCRFNADRGIWYIYDGVKWTPDKSETAINSTALIFRDILYHYIQEIEDPDKKREFEKNVFRLGDRNKRLKMIQDARSLCAAYETDFDQDPDLLNCRNGILKLSTGELLDHHQRYMLTKCCNADYNPQAGSARWDRFIDQIMEHDPERKEYLQRITGYGISGTNEQETMFMLYGASTRNGKSTFLETVAYVLGDYADTISPDSLAASRQKSGAAASPDIAKLKGVRFLKCSEPEKSMIINPVLFKNLTGGDSLTARELYQRPFTFQPQFKLYMNTNYLPAINDQTIFTSQRIQVLPFNRHFGAAEQDKSLKRKLRSEENCAAVLRWLLAGFQAYQTKGVTAPAAVVEATRLYEKKSDKIGSFLDDCYTADPSGVVTMSEAYAMYRSWCAANGYGIEGKSNFKQYFVDRGMFRDTATVSGRTFHNVLSGFQLDPNAAEIYRL